MPIFMDRHDVSDEVTAEYVARLHQEDLKIEKEFGCRGLTYWFDGKRKMAFCLIEAPRKEIIIELHEKAHGGVPSQIIEVDPRIVESFLGRIEDSGKNTGSTLNIIDDSPFRIIMLISFPWLLPENSSGSAETFGKEIASSIFSFEGSVIKKRRDSLLVSFVSASKAVDAALAINNAAKQSIDNRSKELKCKISLAAGIPVTNMPHIFEDTLKTAERFCRLVDGEVIISSIVKELFNTESDEVLELNKDVRIITAADEIFLNHLSGFVEKHSSDANLKVDDLTKPTICSKSRLYRNLKMLANKSPNELINQYRLEEAFKILNSSDKTVTEVAFETGFTSPSYFTKCFHKKYDYLPSNYLHKR